jgi:RNA polymerase sigma-70 factor, ECF subfamily
MARLTRTRPGRALPDTALRGLWDEHAGPVYALAMRLSGGDRGRAEDVVQETLLRARQHPAVLDSGHKSVRPWLFTVARRVLIDQHRAQQFRPERPGEQPLEGLSVDDGVDEALDRWLVTDALVSLTPTHREALVHTYYAGRTRRGSRHPRRPGRDGQVAGLLRPTGPEARTR